MISDYKNAVWLQFGAAIDMLDNTINACPEELWDKKNDLTDAFAARWYEYWYLAFHTLFWLDYYLSESREDFAPPAPFGLEELDPQGAFPPRVYTKDELCGYLAHNREKCRTRIASLTEESALKRFRFGKMHMSMYELLLYNMRHVQHHAAQLNLILRQFAGQSQGWIGCATQELEGKKM